MAARTRLIGTAGALMLLALLVYTARHTQHSGAEDGAGIPIAVEVPYGERLGNLHDFQFLITPEPCPRTPLFLVILVDSAPSHKAHRVAIRLTYASESIPGVAVKAFFMFGKVSDPAMQKIIDEERELFGDVIQGNFVDHYRNQSYTDLMGFRWVAAHCPHAEYIMKTDDDTFFDPYQLVDVLHDQFGSAINRMICVHIAPHFPVVRDKNHEKWYMSKEEFPDDFYDPYCLHSSFFLTPRTAHMIDKVALWDHAGLSINDIYLSGRLVKTANLTLGELVGFTPDERYWARWAAKPDVEVSSAVIAPFPGGNIALGRALAMKFRRVAAAYSLPRLQHRRKG